MPSVSPGQHVARILVAFLFGAAFSLGSRAGPPDVAAGLGNHTLFLDTLGRVSAVGDNAFGQLGLGRAVEAATPVQVNGLGPLSRLAAGDGHVVALKTDGTVWTWGSNNYGQLGDGSLADRSTPQRVRGLSNVVFIAAGRSNSAAIRQDGTVWVWGGFPALGDTQTASKIPMQVPQLSGATSIKLGSVHTVVLKGDGTVWTYGLNSNGQLCDGSTSYRFTPAAVPNLGGVTAIAAGGPATFAIKGDGTFWACGSGYAPSPVQVAALAGTTAIAASEFKGLALKADGTVWDFRSAGAPAPVAGLSGVSAISAGTSHSLALKTDQTVWAWGQNLYGVLGRGVSDQIFPPVTYPPAQVPGLTQVVAIDAAGVNSSALGADGSSWIWGANLNGQFADGASTARATPALVGGLTDFVSVATGWNYSLGLKADGTVWSWGDNLYGQLGDGTYGFRGAPVQVAGLTGVVAISAGGYHALALKSDGAVFAWGWNISGQLGTGTTDWGRTTPVQVIGLTGITAIAAGGWYGHSLALRQDGTVWAWGNNSAGQLGDGTVEQRLIPVQVPGLSNVAAIAAGFFFSAAAKGDGSLWTWGANDFGQLGGTSSTTCTFFTSAPCTLVPTQVAGITQVTAVALGRYHALARRQDGSIWSWGDNRQGQLGDGLYTGRATPRQVAALPPIARISAGGGHSVAVGTTGTVWTWGGNSRGQLGDGTFVLHGTAGVALRGSGTVETNDWFLDLDPSSVDTIPAAFTPKLLVAALALATDTGISLEASLKYRSSDLGKNVRVFAMGLVPPEFFAQVKVAPGAPSVETIKRKAAGNLVLAQLTPAGWTNINGQLIAYSHAVATAAGNAASILDGVSTGTLAGARFCIGYGESVDAMLSSQTLREVLLLEGAAASTSGLPCVLSGTYVEGPGSSIAGSPVTFKASVVGLSPTGSIQFLDGLAALSSAPLEVVNEAVSRSSITTSTLGIGSHSISGSYSGDAQNQASASEIQLEHRVKGADPRTVGLEIIGPVSSEQGQPVTFLARLTGDNPAGNVQFRDGQGLLGPPAPIVQGTARLTTSGLATGSHSISASYEGDSNNSSATSTGLSHTVYSWLETSVAMSSSSNPAGFGAPVSLTVTVSGNAPTGIVVIKDEAAIIASIPLAGGNASSIVIGLASGVHPLTATYLGDGNNPAVTSPALFQVVSAQPIGTAPAPFSFEARASVTLGAIQVSNPITVRGLSATVVPVVVDGGEYSIGCSGPFTTAAGMISNGQAVCVRHAASIANSTATYTTLTIGGVSATFTSITQASTFSANLSSLVSHYYQSILDRTPDASGQAFWESEAIRVAGLRSSVNEALYAMAMSFYNSAEYLALNRNPTDYVRDLYETFFRRSADSVGLSYWSGQIGAGMPREVVLVSFMFSPEFATFARAAIGATPARAEVDTVMDFYRGLLGRLPDSGGFNYWVGRFRAAQCEGASAIYAQVEAISSAFASSAEYIGRSRSNSQFVGDLYNAFLRRGADLGGVLFWIGQIDSGARSRETLRRNFIDSAEFNARVNAMIGQGCML